MKTKIGDGLRFPRSSWSADFRELSPDMKNPALGGVFNNWYGDRTRMDKAHAAFAASSSEVPSKVPSFAASLPAIHACTSVDDHATVLRVGVSAWGRGNIPAFAHRYKVALLTPTNASTAGRRSRAYAVPC